MKKIIYLILAAIIIISASGFSSCGDGDAGRTAFAPETGAYKIMLNPDEWLVIELSAEPVPEQLAIFHAQSGTLMVIDYYSKAGLSNIGVANLNGFMDFYKSIERIKSIYEDNNSRAGDLTDIAKNDIKKSSVTGGKRQSFNMQGESGDYMTELMHLETKNYYLAISYSNSDDKFADSQKAANDVVAHIGEE